MYVVQLAVEGMRGFPERERYGFRGHLDVMRASDADKRGALVDILFHTLFPAPERSRATEQWVEPNARACRAVLTVAGRDKVPYRLLRNLRAGTAKLYRFDTSKNAHELLTDDSREASQFLRVQMQLPDDATFERLFLFAADARPSRGRDNSRSGSDMGGGQLAASGPGLQGGLMGSAGIGALADHRPELTSMFPLPSVLQESTGLHAKPSGFSMHNALVQHELELSGTADIVPDSTDDDLQAKYRELSKELGRARKRDQAERMLALLAEKQTEAEVAAAELRDATANETRLRRELSRFADVRDLPEDFQARLKRHEKVKKSYLSERKRIDSDTRRVNAALESPPGPWWRDPRTLGGLAGAASCLVAAPLLDLPVLGLVQIGFGCLAGWGGLRAVAARELYTEHQELATELGEESQRVERRFQLDTSAVRGMMARFDGLAGDELVAQVERLRNLEAELRAVETRIAGALGQRGRRAEEVLRRVEERKERCEEALSEVSDSPPLDSLQRRLEGLAGQLRARGLAIPEGPSVQNLKVPVVRGKSGFFDAGDEEEDGYGSGYGVGGASDDDDGAQTAPGSAWLCIGSGMPAGGAFGGGSSYGGGGGGRTRSRLLLESAADVLGSDVETVASSVQPRAERFVKALTSRTFTQARFVGAGDLVVLSEQGERAFEELDGADQDRVDAALRFALLESVLKVRRVPVFVEEPVAALPQDRRDTLRRIYSHLAAMTQVLVLTPAADLDGHVVRVD